jgi:hypothetical protein
MVVIEVNRGWLNTKSTPFISTCISMLNMLIRNNYLQCDRNIQNCLTELEKERTTRRENESDNSFDDILKGRGISRYPNKNRYSDGITHE